jgi:hypothetical protein
MTGLAIVFLLMPARRTGVPTECLPNLLTFPEIVRALPFLVFALGVLTLFGLPADAFAGAWTQEPGKGQVITTITLSRADDAYDSSGARTSPRHFRKKELKSLVEYGLLKGVTLVLAPSAEMVSDDASGTTVKTRGLASTDLALRLRLFTRGNQVISVEPHVLFPGTIANETNALLSSGKTEFELRALYGMSGQALNKPYFINAEAAYRFRSSVFADEWRADLSIGISPLQRWQIIAKTSSIVSTEVFSLHKAGASIVYALSKRISLEAGMMRAIAGQDVVRENAYVAGVWVRF